MTIIIDSSIRNNGAAEQSDIKQELKVFSSRPTIHLFGRPLVDLVALAKHQDPAANKADCPADEGIK